MELSVTAMWLIAGVVFLAAEALGASGIGLLFAGLSALTVGTLLSLTIIGMDATLQQWVLFLAFSALWAALLWKPLKKFRQSKQSPGFSNMIGETAYVGSAGLKKGHDGEATWSGTIMKAELAADAGVEAVEGGSQVVITEVKGATLIVKPR